MFNLLPHKIQDTIIALPLTVINSNSNALTYFICGRRTVVVTLRGKRRGVFTVIKYFIDPTKFSNKCEIHGNVYLTVYIEIRFIRRWDRTRNWANEITINISIL